jgi:alpha-tubulin suppressor-like RCC1 family protein
VRCNEREAALRLGGALVIVLGVTMGGCSLVANLGDPRQLESSDDAGDGSPFPAEGGDDGGGTALLATAIAVGASHACAVVSAGPGSLQNGTIRCWGSNDAQQLGIPTPPSYSSTPVPVVGAGGPATEYSGAETLTIAAYYSCATTGDNYLVCWGTVPEGSGVTREQSTAADEPSAMDYDLSPLGNVVSASMGPTGGCVTLNIDGSLVCWGGDLAPSQPDGGVVVLDGGVIVGDAFASVSVGTSHACGIAATSSSASSDVECWGDNQHGQTGLAFSALVSHPNHLGLGTKGPLKSAAAGGDTACALFVDGSVYCWGRNDYGQLGQGAPGPDSYVPLPVPLPATAIAISVADFHVCAILDDRSVACWGDDSSGQLGQGPNGLDGATLSGVPVAVLQANGHPLRSVLSIAAGGRTTCAMLLGGEVSCWGANDQGQSAQPNVNGPVPYATRVAL